MSPSAGTLRILLTGAGGQVASELERSLASLGSVVATGREQLDLSRPEQLREMVREIAPSLIVNAAAYTAVDAAESDEELALAVNGTAPGVLAQEAARLDATLIHYSTDYVFDGSGTEPWSEGDPPEPCNAYGRSKLAGERAIQATDARYLILRTSWVYGLTGNNFVRTMLRLGAVERELRVVDDQIGSPTSARVIADVTARILAGGVEETGSGLVHLTCAGETSWYGFASEIFRLARQRGDRLAVESVQPVASEEFPRPAARPKNSRLSCRLLAERFGIHPPAWEAALVQSLPLAEHG